jgi:Leucine-rich repeat (LRR) protein
LLHGSVPPDIGDRFPAIQVLALNNNWFCGAIPSSLSNLSALQRLDLSENNFTGLVPPTFGCGSGKLHSLAILYLGENQLEADDCKGWEFITSLANCSQLQQLTLLQRATATVNCNCKPINDAANALSTQ